MKKRFIAILLVVVMLVSMLLSVLMATLIKFILSSPTIPTGMAMVTIPLVILPRTKSRSTLGKSPLTRGLLIAPPTMARSLWRAQASLCTPMRIALPL